MRAIRNILERITGTTKSAQTYLSAQTNRADVVNLPRVGRDRATRLVHCYRGPIARCVDLIAEECAATELKLYRKAGRSDATEEEWVEVTDAPILESLRKANDYQSGVQFATILNTYLELAGDVGIHIDATSADYVQLFPMAPNYTEVHTNSGGVVTHYTYGKTPTDEIRLGAEEVVWITAKPNLWDVNRGASWVSQIFKEWNLHEEATDGTTALMANSMRPDYVVLTNGPVGEQARVDAEKQIQANYTGPRNRGKVMVLSHATLESVAFSPKDAELIALLDRNEKQVCQAAGVPEAMYRLNDANLAGARTADYLYYKQTIAPRLARLASQLNEKLLPYFFEDYENYCLEFEDVVPEDEEAEAKQAEAFAQRVTDLAIKVTTGQLPEATAREIAVATYEDEAAQIDRVFSTLGTFEARPTNIAAPLGLGPAVRSAAPAETKAACACGSCRTTKALEVSPNAPDNINTLADQFAEALASWHRSVLNNPIGDAGIVPTNSQLSELEALSRAWITRIVRAGGLDAIAQVGEVAPFDDGATMVTNLITDRVTSLVSTVPETLRIRVAGIIDAGLAQGQTINQVAEAVRSEAPDLAGYQAERIARTESSAAYNEGAVAGWVGVGIEYKTWLTAGGPCPICDAFEAKYGGNPIPITEQFEVEGVSVLSAPAHPNCRCTVLPAWKDATGKAVVATRANRKARIAAKGNKS